MALTDVITDLKAAFADASLVVVDGPLEEYIRSTNVEPRLVAVSEVEAEFEVSDTPSSCEVTYRLTAEVYAIGESALANARTDLETALSAIVSAGYIYRITGWSRAVETDATRAGFTITFETTVTESY